LLALCILVAQQAVDPRVRALETFMAALFSLTGPFSILFLPLVAPRLLRVVKGARPIRSEIVPVVIAAGALIQLGFASASARISTAVAQSGPLSLQELMTVVSMHTFFNAIFGINGFTGFYRMLPPLAYGLGLGALAFFLFVAVLDRVKPLLILFYLSALSIALSFMFPLNDLRIWLHPQAGPRYFVFACLFILLTLLHLALTASPRRGVGLALLGVAVVIGIPADFFHPGQPDVRWADNAAVFRSRPPGSDFYVPVVPLYHVGMVLHNKATRRGPPALSLLQPVASRTPADFSINRPMKVGLNEASNDKFLGVAGWAIDGPAREPAGGVFVMIDEKLFPAVYGLQAQVNVGGDSYTDCGFSRLIPIDEIGPGPHQVSIAVLTRDGTGYYQPPPSRTFATSQFFP
jgi:hypothetical protein